MADNNKRILVTGAGGLIGREIIKQLSKNNCDIIGVDDNSRSSTRYANNYINCNLQTFIRNNHNDFDIIYHMAAINGTSNFYSKPSEVLKNNTLTDLDLFEFVESNKKTKLIYASSSEVISGSLDYPTAETSNISIENIYNPRWSYRLPKILSEHYLMNSNIDFVIVRFFNIYSEYSSDGHFLRDIVNKLKNNKYVLHGADETRSFCYVSDAVDALLSIEHTTREVFNIGSDEEITVLDAANIIANSLNIYPTWKCIKGLDGSTKRRQPDLSKLKNIYKTFNPSSFKNSIEKIKHLL